MKVQYQLDFIPHTLGFPPPLPFIISKHPSRNYQIFHPALLDIAESN